MKNHAKLSLVIIMAFAAMAWAASSPGSFVTKTYTNTGNTRAGFLVVVSSDSWSTILPASAIRRYSVIHATSTTVIEVCLSTISVTATVCSATLPGRHIPQVGIVIEDNSEAALYARVIDGNAADVNLMGERQHHDVD